MLQNLFHGILQNGYKADHTVQAKHSYLIYTQKYYKIINIYREITLHKYVDSFRQIRTIPNGQMHHLHNHGFFLCTYISGYLTCNYLNNYNVQPT